MARGWVDGRNLAGVALVAGAQAMTPYYEDGVVRVFCGDALETLRVLPDASVQACVTSPPYWGGVRDYGAEGQLGLERDPADYASALVGVFAELRRVLAPTGCLWLNIGDVYAASGKGGGGRCGDRASWATVRERKGFRAPPEGFKPKDLTLVPLLVADALRTDGWYLRATIVWSKPAASEPMRIDRPALSHEYLFLLTQSEYYDVRDPGESWWGRTVWTITPDRSANHPGTMPTELARRCIACSTTPGDTVLDPFAGAGTTLYVAKELGRKAIGIELNPDYALLAADRVVQHVLPLEAS